MRCRAEFDVILFGKGTRSESPRVFWRLGKSRGRALAEAKERDLSDGAIERVHNHVRGRRDVAPVFPVSSVLVIYGRN